MSSISSISSDSTMQQLMAQMYTKMSKADTDGTAGLSKTELSSIDTSGDAGGGAFLQSLSNQFSTLDSDQDGQLSSDEISQAQPVQSQDAPLGPPPGMSLDSDSDSTSTSDVSGTSSTSTDNSYSSLLDSLLKSVMNTFDTNGDGKISQDEISEVLGNSGSSSSSDSTSTDTASTDTSSAVGQMGPPPGPPMGPPPSNSSVSSTTDATSAVDSSSSDSSKTSDKATSTISAESFLKDFINHYDTNSDGKVSMNEFKSVFDSEQTSANSGDSSSKVDTSSTKTSSSSESSDSSKSDFGEELKNLSSKFLQKLIDSYNDTGSSGLSSALSSVL